MKKIKKMYLNIKLKIERSLIAQIIRLKLEKKNLKKEIKSLTETNHKLIDTITLKNIEIRSLSLGVRNERND